MLLSHTLTKQGSHVASLVEYRSVVLEEVACQADRRTDLLTPPEGLMGLSEK